MRLIYLPETSDTNPMLINPDLITAVIRRPGKIDVHLSGTTASVAVWGDTAEKLWEYLLYRAKSIQWAVVDLDASAENREDSES